MKNIPFLLLLIFAYKGYSKEPFINKTDSNNKYLYNVQLRIDFKTPFEYQFMFFRPEKFSFSLKIANVNYVGEILGVRVNSYSNNNFGVEHKVKGFTLKPGIHFPIEQNKKSYIFVGLNGVFSYINNEINLSNGAVGYNETFMKSNYLFGAELEFTQMTFILNHFHLGISEVIGYKNMEIYDLESIIENFPKEQIYAPAQGYSPLPVYVSVSVFLGVNF